MSQPTVASSSLTGFTEQVDRQGPMATVTFSNTRSSRRITGVISHKLPPTTYDMQLNAHDLTRDQLRAIMTILGAPARVGV